MKAIALAIATFFLALPALAQTGNVILILADDLGNDQMSAGTYNEESPGAIMPTLDTMATNGVLFRHAYAESACSPTRAAILTGHNPSHYRNQVGRVFTEGNEDGVGLLDTTYPNLVSILALNGYRVEAIGKWHLAIAPEWHSSTDRDDGIVSRTESHPNDFGFTFWEGNLYSTLASYTGWYKWTNGVYQGVETTYATSDQIDLAITKLSGSEPFFIYLALNAPHSPWHEPPDALLDDPTYYSSGGWTDFERYQASIEAMDTELGRLFSDVNFDWSDTTVIFMGDNGTPQTMCQGHPSSHCKRTMYEGGINVPLIIRGEAVAVGARGQEATGLIQVTDIFATILDIAGVTPAKAARPDAISAKSYLTTPGQATLRSIVYVEETSPIGGPFPPIAYIGGTRDPAARDTQYKLILSGDEFYDLDADPYEASPLDTGSLTGPQQTAYDALQAAVVARDPQRCCGATDNEVRRLQ